MHKSGITGSWGRLFPNFLRNHHTGIQRGYTSLYSHQQCKSVIFSPQPLQQKLSSVFLILAIISSVRWTLRVVLICISLKTKGVEHFLKCLSAILDSSVESSLFRSLRFHLTPVRMIKIKKHWWQLILERLWGKGNTPALLVGVQNGTAPLDISMVVSQKIRKQPSSRPNNTSLRYIQRMLNSTTRTCAQLCS